MKKLLLVGAGHAHLYLLKKLQKTPLPNIEITLLTPSKYQYYSGMFSGFAEGLYTIDEIRVNVNKLAEAANVDWKKRAVKSLDPEQKNVSTDDGDLVSYDLVSFDIGSLTSGTQIPGVMEYAKMVKPNYRISDIIQDVLLSPRLVVVGGGAAGVEMALSLNARRIKKDPMFSTILVSSNEILRQRGNKAMLQAERILEKNGVLIHKNDDVKSVMKNQLKTDSGEFIPFDTLLWLAGPKPQQIFVNGKLPTDEKGYLLVEDTLQVKQHPEIFAAGDCASLSSFPHTEKSGVQAVRQAPILWRNIKGHLTNGTLKKFRPPSSTLSILSTGNQMGLLLYKGIALYGKWPWKLKDWIDRRFVKKYSPH